MISNLSLLSNRRISQRDDPFLQESHQNEGRLDSGEEKREQNQIGQKLTSLR